MGLDFDTFKQGKLKRFNKAPDKIGVDQRQGGSRPRSGLGRKSMPRCTKCGGWDVSPTGKRSCSCEQPQWIQDHSTRDTFIAFLAAAMGEALRCLKPCHYGLVWAIPRTSHWTGTALEEAGFEIRDRISHLFGTGFPKGQGCLKPACEDWWLCRRPGRGVLPLSIDECRIPTGEQWSCKGSIPQISPRNGDYLREGGRYGDDVEQQSHPAGRYPANVCLSHHPDCRQVGVKKVKVAWSQPTERDTSRTGYGGFKKRDGVPNGYADANGTETIADWECHPDCPVAEFARFGEKKVSGSTRVGRATVNGEGSMFGQGKYGESKLFPNDSGSAARFFYCAKASRSDRGEGNTHPTCKSTELMSWLVKLISRPGDVVLDPFMGSGSTALACIRSGRKFIGVENNPEYFTIACNRILKELEKTPLFNEELK